MAGYFLRQRQALSVALGASEYYWRISPLMYSALLVLREELPAAVSGKVLDAGAGDLTARGLLVSHADAYLSMDVERRHAEVDIVDDIQTFASVADQSFDTVYSAQVLEHVPQPWLAVQQIHRILKPGGKVVLSVPHLSHLHEEPHDYYRFTPHALRYLLEREGFQVLSSRKMGSVLSMLLHPLSMFLVLAFRPVPVLGRLLRWGNFILLVWPCVWLERALGLPRRYPANLLVVAARPGSSAA